MIRIVLLIFALVVHLNVKSSEQPAESSAEQPPKKLVLALQPHDAKKIQANGFKDNIMVKLAGALNVTVEVYECPWARCMQAIKKGHADVIDDLFFSPDRDEFAYFLKPHFEQQSAGFRFFADNSRLPPITSWEQLYGLRIGMLRGYKHFPRFDQDKQLLKQDFIEVNTIAKMILHDRLDVFIAPPSFDEENFNLVDVNNRLTQQPLAHMETLPLYIGLSRRSEWFKFKTLVESKLNLIVK